MFGLLKSLFTLIDIDDLPATEDTRGDKNCYIEIMTTDVVEVVADANYSAGDFVLIPGSLYPLCGIVNSNVLSGDIMSVTVKDGIVFNTAQIGTGASFGTAEQEVYFDPGDTLFYDTSSSGDGRVGIGALWRTLNSDGLISVRKRRYYAPNDET